MDTPRKDTDKVDAFDHVQQIIFSDDKPLTGKQMVGIAAGSLVLGFAISMSFRYRVCAPNQFMVRTGMGIDNMSISRKGFVWPFQDSQILDMNPKTYRFDLHNMSKEKVEFNLPVVYTIGPIDPLVDRQAFQRFATTMNSMDDRTLTSTIQGIIEGETRGLTTGLTVEEMFNAKDKFRDTVVTVIQEDLNKGFGLHIYNANIQEMKDYDANNKYFEYRKQRAIETANFEAKVDVARAQREGETGMKEQQRDTRIRVAEMEKQATVVENQQQQDVAQSNALLKKIQEESRLMEQLATINANNESKKREEEMMRDVEERRAERELETLRANDLNKSKVSAERMIVEANGEAESIQRLAHANFIKAQKEADGALYKSQKCAEGIEAMLNAQAAGLANLLDCGAQPDIIKFYLGLEKGLPQELTRLQAEGLRDMKPQVSIWNTGSDANQQDATIPLIKMFQSFAPMMDGMQKHAGQIFGVKNVPDVPK